jgi:antirestriction protein ArdC
MKGYHVFNAEQIDGLPDPYYVKPEAPMASLTRNARAEAFFAATEADLRLGGSESYYSTLYDYIQMPFFEGFRDAEAYYATLAHEATHWTMHPSRLNRNFGQKRRTDRGYGMEELIAELGSAFLCAHLELTPAVREEHAAYIGYWLKTLKEDNRAIFTAASHAQAATDFLHALQPKAEAAP